MPLSLSADTALWNSDEDAGTFSLRKMKKMCGKYNKKTKWPQENERAFSYSTGARDDVRGELSDLVEIGVCTCDILLGVPICWIQKKKKTGFGISYIGQAHTTRPSRELNTE